MNDIKAGLRSWLQGGTALTALLGGGTASVYYGEAPRGAADPYVIYARHDGGDMTENPERLLDLLFTVKGVSETSAYQAGQVAAAIDARLHDQVPTISGWVVWMCVRDTPVDYVVRREDGGREFHDGAIYRVGLYKTD